MTDRESFAAWQASTIRHLLAVPGVELALVLRDTPETTGAPSRRTGGPVTQRRRTGGKRLWNTLERSWFNARSRAMQPADLSAELSDVTQSACRLTRDEAGSLSLSETDLEAVRLNHLDALLSFVPGPAASGLAESATHGVWSFQRRDERSPGDDGPLGLWEVYRADTVTGAALTQTTSAGQIILRQGAFRTFPWSFVSSRDQVLQAIACWPAQICRERLAGHADDAGQGDDGSGAAGEPDASEVRRYREPNAAQLALLVVRQFVAFARKGLLSLSRRDHWMIGLIDRPLATVARSGDLTGTVWMDEVGDHRLIADPHGLQRGETSTILVEDVDPQTARGRISAVDYHRSTGFSPLRVVIDLPTHMSYPSLLTVDGSIYCIPETSAQRRVVLFRAESFPDRWQEVATLIDDRALADATLFFHEDRWWLWALDNAVGDNCALVLWYADSLTGPWSEHPSNPVKLDVRSARPAGAPFLDGGRFYRPAQDCSVTYGGRIVLNEVTTLSTERYAEHSISVIEPDATSRYPLGVHTISAVGDMTVIDGKRRSANGLRDIGWALRKGLGRIRSRA